MKTVYNIHELEKYITELESLHSEWSTYAVTNAENSNSGGAVVDEIENIKASLQMVQNAFVELLKNTVSYMEERKESVETKEDQATESVIKMQTGKC